MSFKSLIYILSNARVVRIIRTFEKINKPRRFCQWWELHNKWRRDRDSNPGDPFGAYTLSRRAPSTARPSLHINFHLTNYQRKILQTLLEPIPFSGTPSTARPSLHINFHLTNYQRKILQTLLEPIPFSGTPSTARSSLPLTAGSTCPKKTKGESNSPSVHKMVEMSGIEPLTFSLRTRRSPN